MVGAFSPSIMESAPVHIELLPVADLAVRRVGYGHPIGSAPARINQANAVDRNAHSHLHNLLKSTVPTAIHSG